jgi:hypothetical protein
VQPGRKSSDVGHGGIIANQALASACVATLFYAGGAMGVMHGVNQRVAQEFLEYSDANLTAKVCTDVPKDAYYSEIRKLPWIGDTDKMDTSIRSPDSAKTAIPEAFLALMKDFINIAKNVDIQRLDAVLSSSNMVGPAGFEPIFSIW